MALTASEEALVRQLLDQQAAILSLAGNEATITSKLGATKVTLADLVAASSLADADLLLTRQGTTDKSVRADILATYMGAELGALFAPIANPTFTGDPKAPTAAQFDNDTSLATTAFVQRALGNSRTTLGVYSDLTLSGAEAGAEIFFGASNVTLTLPDSSSFQVGAAYFIDVGPASGITLASIGSQILRLNNVDTLSLTKRSSISLGQMSTFKVVNLGGGTWGVSEYGGLASLSANGYQKLPSGLILQWGKIEEADGNLNGRSYSFPLAFPNAPLSFSAVAILGSDTYTAAAGVYLTSALSAAQFRIASSNGIDARGWVYWIAIGY